MSEFMRIGGLPMTVRRGAEFYVLPADGTARSQPLGGPFPSADAARWFVVEYLETQLTLPQRELWRKVMKGHVATVKAGHELGLIDMVRHDRTFEQIEPYMQPEHYSRRHDHRMAAAGDNT